LPAIHNARPLAFWLTAVSILIVAALTRGRTIGRPIETGFHDLGVRQALAARNFLTYGILETRGAMVLNGGPAAPDEIDVYAHHPTLLPIILAGVFRVFGDSLDVYRSAHIAISLISIALLMRLMAAAHGRIATLAAGFCVAVCPLSAFFATGGDIVGEGLNLFILAGLVLRIAHGKEGTTAVFVAELACYALATFYDWVGVFGFGIPLADAIIRGAPRGGFKRGFAALGAGLAAFGVVYVWSHLVVPARFPKADAPVGSLSLWTPFKVLAAMREIPIQMRMTIQWFLSTQWKLLTPPILGAAAIGWIAILIAALRGRFRESGGRVLVLLLVPGAAFFVTLTGMFFLHTYSTILIVPAIGAAAGACAGFVWRLKLPGRIAVLGWAAWCAWAGTAATRDMFESTAPTGMYEASIMAAAQSAPDTLLVTYHPVPWVMAYYSRRNVVADVTAAQSHPLVDAYRKRHPDARVIYLLPPRPPVPWGLPDAERQALDDRYTTIERALAARAEPQAVGRWRIYSIP
jgi:hypothetical protein